MNLDLKYYFSILLRRSPYLIVIAAIFTSVSLTVAVILPPEYQAQARLLAESEQIPQNLAASTVQTQTSEQLQIIEQRLMTRETLLEIADQFDVYADARADGRVFTASEIVQDMRSRTNIDISGAVRRRGQPATATIVTISFRGSNPRLAAEVTNEFVTRVLQENVEIRTEQAGETLEFFQQEVERLGAELDQRSAQLLEFESEAGLALPQNMQYLRDRLTTLQDRRTQRERDIDALQLQRDRLTELFRMTGGTQQAGQTPLQQQLAAAEQQLLDAQLIYSDANPKLNMLQARVERLRQAVDEQASAVDDQATDSAQPSPQQAVFQQQLADIDAQILALEKEIAAIDTEIEEVEGYIREATENGATISKLQRDFNNTQAQYNQAVARLSTAETGERIELLAKGQRISVIEQATPPQSPTKPNRMLIAAAGTGIGLASAFGVVVLMELLNRSIRRPVELTNRLGITPIGVLPYIRTQREIILKRAVFAAAMAFLIVGVPLIMFGVHTFVTPLDELAEPYLNRIGFSIAG